MSELRPPKLKTVPDRIVYVPDTSEPAHPGGLDGPPVLDMAPVPPKGKTRADFRSEEFIRAIAQHGKYVVWRKAVVCPCITERTNQPNINCTLCDGSGFYYVDPIAIQALMLQFDKNTRIFEKFGMWLDGSTSVTVRPEYRLCYRDSLEMRDSVMCFNEVLQKGNRRGIRAALAANVDSARYRIVSVTRLLAYNQTTNRAIELEENIHFKLTNNGWIQWTDAGNALVPNGATVSIRYNFHPVWIVVSFPHATRDDTSGRKTKKGVDKVVSLPIQGAAKLDFLIDHNGPKNVVVPVTGSL